MIRNSGGSDRDINQLPLMSASRIDVSTLKDIDVRRRITKRVMEYNYAVKSRM